MAADDEQTETTPLPELVGELTAKCDGLYELNDTLQKKCDELTSTCEAQYRTINEQSETLINRQKLLDESQSAYTELLDQSVKEIDSLRQANESIAGPEPGEVAVGELCDALEDYGLNCARVAANDVHNAVAVAFIQISTRIKNEGWTWQQALSWFSTGK